MFATEVNYLEPLFQFLKTETPRAWLEQAVHELPLLLVDHAHCERKAAATALSLISKYPEQSDLVSVMSPLAREELLHFEKVLNLIKKRNILFGPLSPSGYAQTLHQEVSRQGGPDKLRDLLIVGAIIEARSCERFNALIPYLQDQELAKFYASLVKSEARHFEGYLALAKHYAGNIDERIEQFVQLENELITKKDKVFRFHSGPRA